jgi:hypothetical protein
MHRRMCKRWHTDDDVGTYSYVFNLCFAKQATQSYVSNLEQSVKHPLLVPWLMAARYDCLLVALSFVVNFIVAGRFPTSYYPDIITGGGKSKTNANQCALTHCWKKRSKLRTSDRLYDVSQLLVVVISRQPKQVPSEREAAGFQEGRFPLRLY